MWQGVYLGDIGLTLAGEGRLKPASHALSKCSCYEWFSSFAVRE